MQNVHWDPNYLSRVLASSYTTTTAFPLLFNNVEEEQIFLLGGKICKLK